MVGVFVVLDIACGSTGSGVLFQCWRVPVRVSPGSPGLLCVCVLCLWLLFVGFSWFCLVGCMLVVLLVVV